MSSPPSFLLPLFPSPPPPNTTRPRITLTFAQSLDAKIAASNGSQLILSGKESMVMTHWLRTMHDGILIGIGTAISDDPQLNVRLLPLPPDPSAPSYNHHHPAPRPIILDSLLRLPVNCKLLTNFASNHGRRPWVVTPPSHPASLSPKQCEEREARKEALKKAGATIIEVVLPSSYSAGVPTASTEIPIPAILQALFNQGITSVMVEGGARVISSFFASGSVDTLIITVAPVLVGSNGTGYACLSDPGDLEQHPVKEVETKTKLKFEQVHVELMGTDSVVVLKAVL